MGLDKVERPRRRALRAGPYPKPRGRAPRGTNGLPQVWDKEHGKWSEDEPHPAWAWSSIVELPQLGELAAADAAAPVAAAPAVAWEAPTFWQLEESEPCEESKPCEIVHERAQLTPRGSRLHAIEHISPGGTTRHESRTSPAGASATRERRCSWRSRIEQARREARGVVVHERYDMACACCGLTRHIMPNGRMFPHSLRDTMNTAERAAYRKGQTYAEHGWQCPGSRKRYHGPCTESEEDDSSEDESI